MADYVVRVEASTEEAEKKLKRVDKQVVKLENGATIDIRLPSAEQTLSTLGKIASATAEVGKQALAISRAANIGPGAVINDLEELFGVVSSGAKKGVSAMDMLRKATPQNILGSTFEVASNQANALAQRISNIGYEIFGVTQSVNILRQAFGGMFDETIGREIRLQESLLRTRTTLASTADVAINGKRLTDPFQALMALEGPVEEALQNIRRRSLDIAGTTSDAIVQVFGVVASQVGAFGGTIKDAEDLAITFAGALGTIGMSDPMLATQEIRSILTGNIDQNSVLARSLGLTNEEITKAKTSTEGLVSFLERRLAAFTAGQKLAAQGFAGVVSNIQEVKEEASRSLGKPLLQPLLDSLTVVYQRLQLVFDQILSIADGLGRIGSAAFSGLMSGVGAAPVLQGFDARSQIAAFDAVNAKVAEIAVTVQQQVDSVRPLIAGIANEVIKAIAVVSDGLGALLQGFVAFKWEQLKIVVFQLTSVAKLLNSTIIPLLNQVLKLYGDILSQPIFQYLSQVKTSFDALEKIGVNSVIRLTYLIKYAFLESIQTVIGWIKAAIEFIKATVDKTIKFIAASIETIGVKVNEIGKQIVAGTTQLVVKLVLTISGAIKSLGVILIQAAVALQQSSSKFAGLAVPLSSIGKALLGVDGAAKKAAAGIQNFGVQASQALSKVEQSAQRAGGAIRNVGQIIAGKLGEAAGAAGGKLKDLIFGFVKFQAGLLAWQVVAAGALDLWSRWRRSQEQISERTRAELAVKRLSTTYADLGENASAATRALRDLEQSIVNTRINSATKQYTDLIQKLEDIRKIRNPKNLGDGLRLTGAMLNPENFDVKPRMTGRFTQETFAQAYERTKREQAAVVAQELQELEKFKKKAEAEDKAKQDIQILARERKDIETAIAEYRKQVEKDIADERFKTAQEVGKLEQSLLEERRRVERAELDRQLARQSEGLTGVQATLAQVLGDYERGLFDAQTEAQRRQFEAVQARENLEKSIADYKLKLEEQTERMRKRMNDLNRKVVDYEVAQRERAAKRTLEYTIKSARVATTGYIPGPDDKNKFMDALAGKGISAEKVLSYLYAGGATDLGVQPGADPKDIVAAVLTDPKFIGLQRLEQQGLTWEQALNGLTKRTLGQSMAGTFAIQSARDDFGLNRWYNKEIPAPKPVTGFDDLNKDNERFVQERRVLGERIQSLTAKLGEVLNQNNFKENLQNAIFGVSKRSNFTDMPTLEAANQQLQDARLSYQVLTDTIARGLPKVDKFAAELKRIDEAIAPRAIKQFVSSKNMFASAKPETIDAISQSIYALYLKGLATGKPITAKDLKAAGINLSSEREQLLLALLKGITDSRVDMKKIVQSLDNAETIKALEQDLTDWNAKYKNALRNSALEIYRSIGELAAGDSPLKKRRFAAQYENTLRSIEFQESGKLATPEDVSLLQKLNADTTRVNEELGVFEERLKGVTTRLKIANEVSTRVMESYTTAIANLIKEGDLRSAFEALSNDLGDMLIGSLLESAFRPAQQMLESQLQSILGVSSEQVNNTLALEKNGLNLSTLNTTNQTLTTTVQTLNTTMQALPAQIAAAVSSTAAGGAAVASAAGATTSGTTAGGLTWPAIPTEAELNGEPPNADAQKQQGKFLKDLNRGFSAVTQAAVGVTMAFDGLKRVTEGGGTYETLMGLSSIFMGLGSVFSGIGSIGKKAAGGPVAARMPYLVGEQGPELFIPGANGSIATNQQTAALMASRGALGGKSSAGATAVFEANRDALSATASLSRERYVERVLSSGASATEIKYSRVGSGDLPFVTETDMLQATRLAAQEGARLGQQRTLAALRNNPATRRSVGV